MKRAIPAPQSNLAARYKIVSHSNPTVDVERARAIWAEYQKQHDITPFADQAVGIEPVSGRFWFGETALEIRDKMVADGIDAPFYCVRVGYDYYLRKGARRLSPA